MSILGGEPRLIAEDAGDASTLLTRTDRRRETGPARSHGNQRIDSNNICPSGRQCDQLLFFVIEIDAVFAPGALIRDEFERLVTPRMERMNYPERLRRNVT